MSKSDVVTFLVGVAGVALIVAGVAMLSVPAAFVIAGIACLTWSYLAARVGGSR